MRPQGGRGASCAYGAQRGKREREAGLPPALPYRALTVAGQAKKMLTKGAVDPSGIRRASGRVADTQDVYPLPVDPVADNVGIGGHQFPQIGARHGSPTIRKQD